MFHWKIMLNVNVKHYGSLIHLNNITLVILHHYFDIQIILLKLFAANTR